MLSNILPVCTHNLDWGSALDAFGSCWPSKSRLDTNSIQFERLTLTFVKAVFCQPPASPLSWKTLECPPVNKDGDYKMALITPFANVFLFCVYVNFPYCSEYEVTTQGGPIVIPNFSQINLSEVLDDNLNFTRLYYFSGQFIICLPDRAHLDTESP